MVVKIVNGEIVQDNVTGRFVICVMLAVLILLSQVRIRQLYPTHGLRVKLQTLRNTFLRVYQPVPFCIHAAFCCLTGISISHSPPYSNPNPPNHSHNPNPSHHYNPTKVVGARLVTVP